MAFVVTGTVMLVWVCWCCRCVTIDRDGVAGRCVVVGVAVVVVVIVVTECGCDGWCCVVIGDDTNAGVVVGCVCSRRCSVGVCCADADMDAGDGYDTDDVGCFTDDDNGVRVN